MGLDEQRYVDLSVRLGAANGLTALLCISMHYSSETALTILRSILWGSSGKVRYAWRSSYQSQFL